MVQLTPSPDPCRCPLCGQPNACATASGDAARSEPCWCTRLTFSADLLQRVPRAARDKACICQACVSADHAAQAATPAGGQ